MSMPGRIRESTSDNLSKAYPRELLVDMSTGDFTIICPDGTTKKFNKNPRKLTITKDGVTLLDNVDLSENQTLNIPTHVHNNGSVDIDLTTKNITTESNKNINVSTGGALNIKDGAKLNIETPGSVLGIAVEYTGTTPITGWGRGIHTENGITKTAYFYTTISINGIKSTDIPIFSYKPNPSYSTKNIQEEKEFMDAIYKVITKDNAIEIYLFNKPTKAYPFRLLVIR